jgi:hypothetical protein
MVKMAKRNYHNIDAEISIFEFHCLQGTPKRQKKTAILMLKIINH